jgi:hypothetical protein
LFQGSGEALLHNQLLIQTPIDANYWCCKWLLVLQALVELLVLQMVAGTASVVELLLLQMVAGAAKRS